MRKLLVRWSGLAVFLLLAVGCASTIPIDEPIPPMERIDAMTAFLMDQLALDPALEVKVREIVKTNATMKRTIWEMVREGRVDRYDAERRRMRRFTRQLEAIVSTKEKRKRVRQVASAIAKNETATGKNWPQGNQTPNVGGIGR